jgi:hypothetical protein
LTEFALSVYHTLHIHSSHSPLPMFLPKHGLSLSHSHPPNVPYDPLTVTTISCSMAASIFASLISPATPRARSIYLAPPVHNPHRFVGCTPSGNALSTPSGAASWTVSGTTLSSLDVAWLFERLAEVS